MTRIFDDLEILTRRVMGKATWIGGSCEWTVIADNKAGDNYHQGCVIVLKPFSFLDGLFLVRSLCRELEHYDVAEAIMWTGVMTCSDLSKWLQDMN